MKKSPLLLFCIVCPLLLRAQDLEWAKRMTDSGSCNVYAMQLDGSGNIYVVGEFSHTCDFDTGPGTQLLSTPNTDGVPDAFLCKLSPTGNLIWARSLGNLNSDWIPSIALDIAGNIYITGEFSTTMDFDPGPGVHYLSTPSYYNHSWYVCKLKNDGNLIWAKKMDSLSSGSSGANYLTCDGQGNTYTVGWYADSVDFDSGPGQHILYNEILSVSSNPQVHCFIMKMDPDGHFEWVNGIKGNIDQVCVEAPNHLYLSGTYSDTLHFNPSGASLSLTSVGGKDVFIAKLDTAGHFIWAKNIGGAEDDIAGPVIVGPHGTLYASGRFSNTADFDPGPNIFPLTGTNQGDIFVAKLDTGGNFMWAGNIRGFEIVEEPLLGTNAHGDVYVAGSLPFGGGGDMDPGPATQPIDGHSFISKWDSLGNFIWGKDYGDGYGWIGPNALYIDPSNNIYIAGVFNDTADFDPGPNQFLVTYPPHSFATCGFVSKLRQNSCETLMAEANSFISQDGSLLSTSLGNVTYQWVNCAGNQPIPGAVGPSFVATENGSYALLVGNDSCSVLSSCFTVNSTGIGESQLPMDIHAYPIPTDAILYLTVPDGWKITSLKIVNLAGQTLHTITQPQTEQIILDVSRYSAGVYFMEMEQNGKRHHIKWVKQ